MGLLGFKLASQYQRAAAAGALNGRHGHKCLPGRRRWAAGYRHRRHRRCSPVPLASSLAAATSSMPDRKGRSRRVRPVLTVALRRRVMSRVETLPDAQAVPGYHPDLADTVHYLAAAIEHQGVAPVEHQVAARLGRLGQDLAAGGGVGQRQAGPGGRACLAVSGCWWGHR